MTTENLPIIVLGAPYSLMIFCIYTDGFSFSFTLVFSLVKRICDFFRKLKGLHDLVDFLIDKRHLVLTVLYCIPYQRSCMT